MNKESCLNGCNNWTNATSEQKNKCVSDCEMWYSGNYSSGGGMHSAAGGGSMGSMDNCRYGAEGVRYGTAHYKETTDGPETSGEIICAEFDKGPCNKGSTMGGTPVIVTSYAGAPIGCLKPSTGGTGDGTHYASSMENCIYDNESINSGNTLGKPSGNTSESVFCRTDYGTCYFIPSSVMLENVESAIAGKSPIQDVRSNMSLGGPRACKSGSSGGGSQWSTSGAKWTCTGTNSVGQTNTIRCGSPNVDCDINGSRLDNAGVNKTVGSNPRCVQDSSGAVSGGGGGQPQCTAPSKYVSCGDRECIDMNNRNPGSCPRSGTSEVLNGVKLDCVIDYCARGSGGGGSDESVYCCAPVPECKDSKFRCPQYMPTCEWKARSQCESLSGGGGGQQGGKYMCETIMPPCNSKGCPAWTMMPQPPSEYDSPQPGMNCWLAGSGRQGEGGGGGGQQWVEDISGPKENFLQNLQQQAKEMARIAQDIRVDVKDLGNAYLQGGQTCAASAKTYDDLNNCWEQSEQQSQLVWDKFRQNETTRQTEDFEQRLAEMKQFVKKMATGGAKTQQLEGILSSIVSAINAVRTGTTPEATNTNGIYALFGQFWKTAETLTSGNRGGYGHDGGDYYGPGGDVSYADQCEMIQRKMQHVGENNYGLTSQLKRYYDQCMKYTRGAVTGEDFDKGDFRENNEEFEVTFNEFHEQNACERAREFIDEADYAISHEVTRMLSKIKNPAQVAEFKQLVNAAQGILNQAKSEQDCSIALKIMNRMDTELRPRFENLMASTGVRNKGVSIVNYDDDVQEISQRFAEETGVNSRKITSLLQENEYDEPQIFAYLDTVGPSVIIRWAEARKGATKGQDALKVAAQVGLSATETEKLLEANARIAELEEELAGVKAENAAVVGAMTNYVFSPEIVQEVQDLMKRASKISAKELRASFEALKQKSRVAATGFQDFDMLNDHAWVSESAKWAIDNELVKGTAPSVLALDAPVIRKHAALIAWRHQNGDSGETPEEAVEYFEDMDVAAFEGEDLNQPATRINMTEFFLSAYPDIFASYEVSSSGICKDLAGLTNDQVFAAEVMNAAGVITCPDGTFNPQGIVNRAQAMKMMYTVAKLGSSQQTGVTESDEDLGGSAATTGLHSAAQTSAVAVEASSSSSSEPAPVFNAGSISRKELTAILDLAKRYQLEHSKLSTVRSETLDLSLREATVDTLQNIEGEFVQMVKDHFPEKYIDEQRFDFRLKMPQLQLTRLCGMFREIGKPIAECEG